MRDLQERLDTAQGEAGVQATVQDLHQLLSALEGAVASGEGRTRVPGTLELHLPVQPLGGCSCRSMQGISCDRCHGPGADSSAPGQRHSKVKGLRAGTTRRVECSVDRQTPGAHVHAQAATWCSEGAVAGEDLSHLPGGLSLPTLARHLVDAKMGQAEAQRQLQCAPGPRG